MNTPPAPAPVSIRYALRWRVPVLISCLIALVLAAFLWAAYRRVESTLAHTAGERAQRAADLVAGLLDGRQTTQQLRQATDDPRLRDFLESRTQEAGAAARAQLTALAGAGRRRIELWDNAGSRLIEVSAPPVAGDEMVPAMPPLGASPPATGVGRLQAASGAAETVFTDSVGIIRRADATARPDAADVLGYVRIRSTFTENPPGILSRLLGREAVVRVANRNGDIWTDFAKVVPPTPVDLSQAGVSEYRSADGRVHLGAVSPITDTPWSAWVEFPKDDVIAPAGAFLTGMVPITLMFVVAAAALATVLASRITAPLTEISTAAATLAGGDYSRRVTATRRDEIGQLGRTFNTMAAKIETASEALRRSEDSYRRLFANNPHPMWVYDSETLRFVDVNDMAIQHYGYSRDEFLGMTIADIRPSAALPQLLENLSGHSLAVETSGVWKHRRRDGSIIDVDVSSHAVRLDGRQARVVLAHDVTERLRAQRALEESETLFRDMAETMPHIVWTARPDGRFEYFNHRWFGYTGLSQADTKRSGWDLVLHPDDRQSAREAWDHVVQTGGAYEVTYRLRRAADGVYRWHTGRADPLRNDAGAIVLWVGTSTDTDDARRDQQMLTDLNTELEQRVEARTAQLEAANQELEAFSYSVSHDLRAPLRHVQGYVEMVTAATRGQLSDKVQRYLGTITEATLEMGQLIDDLLAFSRMARVHMSEGPVSLDYLVQDTIVGLEMSTRDRNIVWNISTLPVVIGDPSMLKQVYANLLHNAVKYSRHRDPARIEVGCAGEDAGQWVLYVRDNGAGFDMRYAHKLFGVFQRLHRADEFEGTGIGLATVRRIVTRHGGRTWAEGQLDGGATIYFTMPAAGTPDSADHVQ